MQLVLAGPVTVRITKDKVFHDIDFPFIRKRRVGFKATQSNLGVSEDSKDIKDPKRSGKSQVKVYLELNL